MIDSDRREDLLSRSLNKNKNLKKEGIKMKRTKNLLAVLMVIAFALAMSMSVFAANGAPANGSLTVSGDKEFAGKTVKAYRVFTASWLDENEVGNNDDNIDAGDTISYVLDSAWNNFFSAIPAIATDQSNKTLSQKAAEYIVSLKDDDTQMIQLAKDLKTYAETNNISATYTSEAASVSGESASTTITNMTPGYYLVIPQSGSTSTERGTDATLVNVPSQDSAEWNIKSSYPTVEKTIGDQKETTAKIGDIITFTLTSAVPDMTEYAASDYYTFIFHDTMSDGLTYKGNVTVKIGNTTLTAADPDNDVDGDYVVSSDENTLTITLGHNVSVTVEDDETHETTTTNHRDLRKLIADINTANPGTISAGDTITVTYQAMLNENAIIAGTGNSNTAHVEYSNDPSDSNETGNSTDTETKTYTYQITIDKHDDSTEPVQLAGAVFKLKDSSSTIRLIPTGTEDEYRVANAEEIAATENNQTTETVTTPNNGLIVIKGLAAGTYYLEEVSAPTGFNKLENDIVVVVSESTTTTTPVLNPETNEPVLDPETNEPLTTSTTTTHYGAPTYSVDGTDQNTNSIINVVNTSGTVLPVTGGIGTIIFTVAGVGIVIFGVVITSFKKKKKE